MSSTARQEDFAVTRRQDTAQRAHHASDRRPVPQLVHEWLDAAGHDVCPSRSWANRLLHGMHLSYKKPAKCAPLQSCEQQHANTHRLFIKLCWLVDKHAVNTDRVVNIDETSCRFLLVHQIGWGRRDVKQAHYRAT